LSIPLELSFESPRYWRFTGGDCSGAEAPRA
jgi:hypothetical protein